MRLSFRFVAVGIILIVIAGLVSLGFYTRRNNLAPPDTHSQAPALSVDIIHATQVSWPRVIAASGNIAAWREGIVSAQIGGEPISQVLVDVGDHVKKGQLLARFDDTAVKAALVRFEAQVSQASANLVDAKSKSERATRLKKTNNISEQDLIAAQSGEASAKAQLDGARAQLKSEQLMLGYTRVVAPDDGVISSRSATLGKVAAVGNDLFQLVVHDRLEWRAQLTSDQITLVKPGMTAHITLPDGATINGIVRQLSPTLDQNTRMGIAYIDLPGLDSAARAGMYVSGTVLLKEAPGFALPTSSVVSRDGHDYVFVLAPDDTVSMTQVTTGQQHGADVEIVTGIKPDTPIVKSGGAFLNGGDLVRVVSSGATS